MDSPQAIARLLPDAPRWVEARACLLSGDCEIVGFQSAPELTLVVHDLAGMVFVIGTPTEAAVRHAVRPMPGASLVAAPEHAAWLATIVPSWTSARIIVHELPDLARLAPDDGSVGILDPATLASFDLPADLRAELAAASAAESVIAATFVDQRPVAFCYAGAVTETWWDVSIDTVPGQRQRGYAARCVSWLIRRHLAQGQRPVWQAVEANPASWRLAQKLGFIAVDNLAYFEAPESS